MEAIIEQLYSVFSKYPLAGGLRERSCDCCVTDEEIRILATIPLRELSHKELRSFMIDAISTFGDVEDYKHFLPRILELMVDSESDFIFDFICYEKLNYSEWETWDFNEINAILFYFLELWKKIINDENSTTKQVEEVLTLINRYSLLKGALDYWDTSKTHNSALFIVDGFLNNDFKDAIGKNNDEYLKWLSSEAVLNKLEVAFFKEKDPEIANRISIVYTYLENTNQ